MVREGELVRLEAFGGEQIVRRVVEVRSDVVVVTSEEEYRAARAEQREPLAVGFPYEAVIETVEHADGG